MNTIDVNGATYHLPEDEEDVMALVRQAHDSQSVICTRGAAHSFPLIGTLEKGSAEGKKYLYVMLSHMNRMLSADKQTGVFKAQAGMHLGLDPFDPTGISTTENSLLYQMDQLGWALADLGGITHQTLGGFMATGSAGGTTKHGYDECVLSIEMICYTANGVEKVTFNRPADGNPDDPFFGACVSMGLFGIVTAVTLQGVPAFNIEGQEATTTEEDCVIELFKPGSSGKKSFQQFLETTTYTRCIWWPQKGVNKIVVWQAEPVAPVPGFTPKYYQEVPWFPSGDGSPIPATLAADILFTAIGRWPDWLADLLGTNSKEYKTLTSFVDSNFDLLFPLICDIFVPLDDKKKGPQQFRDSWWHGLPMDNQMNDRLMPVWFTELWIPIDQTLAVMKALKAFYDASPANAGTFCCELYAAKHSACWLSPAYGTDVIRVDVFWFANNKKSPADDFYPRFWKALAPFGYRPHWGKFLPDGAGDYGVDYLKKQYPRWNDWMNLRQRMDPDGVFLNDYWKSHLGLS